jgi:hypothetical protein
MLQVKTQADIQREKEEEAGVRMPAPIAQESALASYVRSCWQSAKMHRQKYTQRFEDCLRRRRGVYSQEKLNTIKQNRSSTVYMKITGAKIKAAKTWLADLFSQAGDRPFTLEPANTPEMPPEIAQQMVAEAIAIMRQSEMTEEQVIASLEQHRDKFEADLKGEAEERAEKMADRIEDILSQAGWRAEFDDFLDDLATYPVAIMSGLEYRNTGEMTWAQNDAGEWSPVYTDMATPKVRRVSDSIWYRRPA